MKKLFLLFFSDSFTFHQVKLYNYRRVNYFMLKIIQRLKDAFGRGPEYYNGNLIQYFDNLFKQLENKLIDPESAKLKVNELFTTNQDLKSFFLNSYCDTKKNLKIIGSKVRLFNRLRFGIISLEENEYEPIHYHNGFISFQIILTGQCVLNEFDKISMKGNQVIFKPYKNQILGSDNVMLNYSRFRDIHGFGAIDGPVKILSIGKYYGLFGKFRLSINNRWYLDIDKQKKVSKDLIQTSLIEEQEAYKKYSKIKNFS